MCKNFTIFITCILLFISCTKTETKKKELLVYCGITMIKPMSEIAKIIEKQENCRITIIKGGSGNLMKSILFNRKGDLFLPGSDAYIKRINEKEKDIIIKKSHVGYNKAAIMVKKGNPLKIDSDLNNFTDKKYAVMICNAESGSIGKESKKIFDKKGIYDSVIDNALGLTTDSKDLVKAIKNDQADIVINWYAVSTWEENRDFMDVIPIDDKFAKKKKLVLSILKFSDNRDIAEKFLNYASSDKGRNIFNKYGLYEIK